MDVWVLYDWVQYEGCSPPLGAYSSEAAAEAARKQKEAEDDEEVSYSISKLTIDAPPSD